MDSINVRLHVPLRSEFVIATRARKGLLASVNTDVLDSVGRNIRFVAARPAGKDLLARIPDEKVATPNANLPVTPQ